jgi:hypothetical protein
MFLDCVVFKEVKIKIRDFYHDFVFPNFAVLKAMDEKGQCLNCTAFEIISDLERHYWIHTGLFDKKQLKSVLPSKSDLQRTATYIETIADDIIPMAQFHTASGEGVKFENMEVVIGLLFKAWFRRSGKSSSC